MPHIRTYKVQWILASEKAAGGGLYGTTSHEGASPAAAAVASAEYVLDALDDRHQQQQMMILSVFAEPDTENLLSDDDLQATLRFHHKPLRCRVTYRPLC